MTPTKFQVIIFTNVEKTHTPPNQGSTGGGLLMPFTFRVSRQKWANLASFRKTEACGQTVLPFSSISIGQKLVDKNETFLVIFKQREDC